MATKDEVRALLTCGYGLTIDNERPIQSGVQIATKERPKVNVFDTGKYVPNGAKLHLLPDFQERLNPSPTHSTRAERSSSSTAMTPAVARISRRCCGAGISIRSFSIS